MDHRNSTGPWTLDPGPWTLVGIFSSRRSLCLFLLLLSSSHSTSLPIPNPQCEFAEPVLHYLRLRCLTNQFLEPFPLRGTLWAFWGLLFTPVPFDLWARSCLLLLGYRLLRDQLRYCHNAAGCAPECDLWASGGFFTFVELAGPAPKFSLLLRPFGFLGACGIWGLFSWASGGSWHLGDHRGSGGLVGSGGFSFWVKGS